MAINILSMLLHQQSNIKKRSKKSTEQWGVVYNFFQQRQQQQQRVNHQNTSVVAKDRQSLKVTMNVASYFVQVSIHSILFTV